MARKYLAFDIETAKDVPKPEFNWREHRPLGISCSAALPSDAREPTVWHGKAPNGLPAGKMSADEARDLVRHLAKRASEGYTILTWNGLGFDFDVLAEESGALEECRELAMNHVDMMFHLFCDRGFPVSLGKVAEALQIPGKPAGMSGALAPLLWSQGRYQEVIDYVAQDARTTLQVAQICDKNRSLKWMTHSGSVGTMVLSNGWLTVKEALLLPEPDTSSMNNPIPRSQYTRWIATL